MTIVLPMAAPKASEPVRILALGDSLTAGYGLPQDQSFPVKLQTALNESGLPAIVYNGGVSGDTSAGGLSRLDWAMAMAGDDTMDAVIVELGANDGLRGLDPAATLANLDTLIGRLAKRDKRPAVLLTGMRAPPNLGPEYGAEFAALYPFLAKKHKIALYPFFLDGVAAIPALNQSDTIHPNSRGVDIVIARILPYIKDMLANRHDR
ncbi:MAG TPA: arylesterase [Rhodospirillales bacterium]|nr:arylesterase [Rhodospirillales bacterium]